MADDDVPEEIEEAEETRTPTLGDLVELCRELNGRGVRYVVEGGFAMRAAGYVREKDIPDLIFLRRLLESEGVALPE